MALNWMSIDSSFPTFQGDESTEKKLKMILDYMMKLTEQLRFTLENLDTGNWNAAALDRLKSDTTSGISKTLEQMQKLVKCSEDGVEVGAADKRVDIVGEIYINGVRYE